MYHEFFSFPVTFYELVKNILVIDMGWSGVLHKSTYHCYKAILADFEIFRSYESVADADTESPTSFTLNYVATELVNQVRRSLSVDIFFARLRLSANVRRNYRCLLS